MTDKIWFKHYEPGVPHTIDPDQYGSLPEMLEESFKKYADQPCFMNFGETLTFKQIDELSQAYAGFLQSECKLKKGDRIAIMMLNTLQYPIALFGAFKAGFISVNISPLSSPEKTRRILQETGSKCVLVLANFAHVIEKAISNTDVEYVVVTEIADLFPFPKRFVFNFVINYIKKIIPAWHIENYYSFREILDPFYQKAFQKPLISGEDLAYLQFTEGRETGRPKCVMLTHRNLIACGLQCSAWVNSVSAEIKEAAVVPVPLFKLVAMSGFCLTFMRCGILGNLITNPLDVSSCIKEMKRKPFSIIFGIRTIFQALLHDDAFQNLDFSSLKLVLSGGASLPFSLVEHWESVTQKFPIQGYVLTEGSPMITLNPLSQKIFTGSVGLPLPSTEIKICNEKGEILSCGMRGEIWVRGPQIMKGYWNKPQKTKEVLTEDGWFKTGDVGTMNAEGYLFLIDRKEDIIEINEHVIYPTEVENKVLEMGGLQDIVLVKGLSKNEKPILKAYIIKKDPSITEEAVLSYCKRYLETYQVPNKIEFRKTLPRSATGYILRHLLRIEASKYG